MDFGCGAPAGWAAAVRWAAVSDGGPTTSYRYDRAAAGDARAATEGARETAREEQQIALAVSAWKSLGARVGVVEAKLLQLVKGRSVSRPVDSLIGATKRNTAAIKRSVGRPHKRQTKTF